MLACTFILSHPQLKESADEYARPFRVKRNRQNKVNACASNLSGVTMFKLDGIIQEVGGFKLSTPFSAVAHPAKCSRDVAWWWQLLKKMFEAAAPENVFDAKWNTVSHMCSP